MVKAASGFKPLKFRCYNHMGLVAKKKTVILDCDLVMINLAYSSTETSLSSLSG